MVSIIPPTFLHFKLSPIRKDVELSPNEGSNKISVPSLKGSKTLLKSFPRVSYLLLLFYLENTYSKKMVFLISSGGIKWSLYYRGTGKGGGKWERMAQRNGPNMGRGDYPHSNESPDILSNPNFHP